MVTTYRCSQVNLSSPKTETSWASQWNQYYIYCVICVRTCFWSRTLSSASSTSKSSDMLALLLLVTPSTSSLKISQQITEINKNLNPQSPQSWSLHSVFSTDSFIFVGIYVFVEPGNISAVNRHNSVNADAQRTVRPSASWLLQLWTPPSSSRKPSSLLRIPWDGASVASSSQESPTSLRSSECSNSSNAVYFRPDNAANQWWALKLV